MPFVVVDETDVADVDEEDGDMSCTDRAGDGDGEGMPVSTELDESGVIVLKDDDDEIEAKFIGREAASFEMLLLKPSTPAILELGC